MGIEQKPTRERVHLVDGWARVLRRAWSVRLALISAALSGVEFALPYFAPEKSSGKFAALAGIVSVSAAVARIVAQPKVWK